MSIPLLQKVRVGSYIFRQHFSGNKRYPLALMLEPLFRCNLACNGCGKIDYPDPILNQRLSLEECLEAVDECGAPVVSIAGGEPLLHKEMPQIVKGIMARKKFVYLCTNALLMEKKIDQYEPSPYFVWSIHLDGDREMHDHSVNQEGVYDRCVEAIGVRGGDRLGHDGDAEPACGQAHDGTCRAGFQGHLQLQAPRQTAVLENRTDARACGHADQRQAGEVVEGKPGASGQRMIFGHGSDEPLRHDRVRLQSRRRAAGADQGDVQSAGVDALHERGGIVFQ